eukprot:m.161770 g.161770  ORF g.161770 m.161770 type:complete len:130 (-) comp31253_c3_seq1:872-1261(-)
METTLGSDLLNPVFFSLTVSSPPHTHNRYTTLTPYPLPRPHVHPPTTTLDKVDGENYLNPTVKSTHLSLRQEVAMNWGHHYRHHHDNTSTITAANTSPHKPPTTSPPTPPTTPPNNTIHSHHHHTNAPR